jgi:hypothetical protein
MSSSRGQYVNNNIIFNNSMQWTLMEWVDELTMYFYGILIPQGPVWHLAEVSGDRKYVCKNDTETMLHTYKYNIYEAARYKLSTGKTMLKTQKLSMYLNKSLHLTQSLYLNMY